MKSTPKRRILSSLRLPATLSLWQWTHYYLLLVLFLDKDRPIFCGTQFSPKPPLTHSCHELLEVDERIPVLIQEAEEPCCQHGGVCPTSPGGEADEQLLELLHVDSVLLQVGQALVAAGGGRTVVPPVTAHQVLGLWGERINRADYAAPQQGRLSQLKNSIEEAKKGHFRKHVICLFIPSVTSLQNNMKWRKRQEISGKTHGIIWSETYKTWFQVLTKWHSGFIAKGTCRF